VGRYQEHHSRFVVSAHVAAEYGPGPRPAIVDFDRAPDERTLADYRVLSDGDAAALFNNNLAVQQMLHGRPHLAERMLRALIEAAPDLPELRNNLGVALSREGRPADARDVLLEALSRSPDYGPLYTNAVAAAHALGHEELARQLEVRGRQAAGDDPLFLFGQGLRRYELHDFRGAAERFEQALRLQDDSPVAWAWLARARLAEGQLDAGRRAFAHARQLAPDDPRLRELLQRAPQLRPN
jgi:tetratricopeptide (TPR) repeat protein